VIENFFFHRIALEYKCGLHEIWNDWSLDDVQDAHDILDEKERLEKRAMKEAKQGSK